MNAPALPFAEQLEQVFGSVVSGATPVGGGHTAATWNVDLADRRSLVVKTGGGGFVQEANGLRELARSNTIRVPEVLHAEAELLVLEHIPTGPPAVDFMPRFGQAFAALHQFETSTQSTEDQQSSASEQAPNADPRTKFDAKRFGFFEDNFIGASPQKNLAPGPSGDDWPTFYWTHRLEPQTRMAIDAGFDFRDDMNALARRLPELLAGTAEAPSLLHGDLWSGNFLCDQQGAPVLIDPAVYYGHREADLGMTHLFGGFSTDFYQAYDDAFPMPPGATERVPLYMLYHVLNHVNLFGGSYAGQARRLMRSYR